MSAGDLVPIETLSRRVKEGTLVKFGDLLDEAAPPAPPAVLPTHLPVPRQITDEQKLALERLPEVFGSVIPAERRRVEPPEVHLLLEERRVLKTVEKMVSERTADIATTIHNHLDVEAEAQGLADDDTPRNKDGHYVLDGVVRGEVSDAQQFTREARAPSPNLDILKLQALADDPEVDWFDHDDYLAMTAQTRVVDPNKAMLHLQKKPNLVRAVREAASRSAPSAAVQPRAVK
jgi:hypothetical protein